MKVETLEKNKRRIEFVVSAERFEEGMRYSYNKNKASINIAGFRKGKAPRKIIEVQYGKEVFYEDAIDFVLPEAYENAKNESGLDIVARPEFSGFDVQPDKTVVFTADVYIKPEVVIGNYKGLTFKKPIIEATEEEVAGKIDAALEKNSREITITDRPVADGDIAYINFKGFVDGVAFENGAGENYELKIGSHTFIDTFEEQLIGHSIGDDVKVNVRFPDEYHSEALAGKEAMFEVEILEIKVKEKPEADDDFASDVSEYETIEEYKLSIKQDIEKEKIERAEQNKEQELLEKLVAGTEMDVPEVMIIERMNSLVNDFSRNVTSRGIDFDMYLNYIGQTEESLKESYREIAANQIKSSLALEALAKEENIQISEDEIIQVITDLAEKHNMDKEKMLAGITEKDKNNIASDLKIQKALEFLMDNAIEED